MNVAQHNFTALFFVVLIPVNDVSIPSTTLPSVLPLMKKLLLRTALAVLAVTALPVRPALAADAIPEPVFLVSGTKVGDGVLETDIPAGSQGKIEGTVTSDGEALVFDGTGGAIVFDQDGRTLFGSPFTVSVLVESFPPKGYGEIIRSGSPKGFSLRTSGHGYFSITTNGEWNLLGTPARSVTQGGLQHVVVVYDGTNMIAYLDGIEVARKELAAPPAPDQKVQIGDVGRRTDGGELVDAPNHRIAQLAVFDVPFTPEQVSALSSSKYGSFASKKP